MDRMNRSSVESLHVAAFGLQVSRPGGDDSRTLQKQYLLDTVLPAAALLSMSVLTVTMIVLVVTTVAHGGWLTPGTYVSVDPWASVYPGPAHLREDDMLHPDAMTGWGAGQSDLSFGAEARYGADAGRFAAGAAE